MTTFDIMMKCIKDRRLPYPSSLKDDKISDMIAKNSMESTGTPIADYAFFGKSVPKEIEKEALRSEAEETYLPITLGKGTDYAT